MRFTVVEYVTSIHHPYMPQQRLFAIYDRDKQRRSMGVYTNPNSAKHVADKKNLNA